MNELIDETSVQRTWFERGCILTLLRADRQELLAVELADVGAGEQVFPAPNSGGAGGWS